MAQSVSHSLKNVSRLKTLWWKKKRMRRLKRKRRKMRQRSNINLRGEDVKASNLATFEDQKNTWKDLGQIPR
ncbi:hypothetical protein RND71_018956 [Anisodus tanguticus]|uniref:60S ribosomal protein L41 n=1 Tax=Anisodus tanguticus TaxID=243964 RepID=A0AAE1VKP9_9SOLA|nr:hypothetical protein RND71_018956 [Anisodus tanguticus]